MFKDFFFSYFYYRLYHLNSNKGDFQGGPAIATITLIQMILLVDFWILVVELFYGRGYFSDYARSLGYIGVLISLALFIFNYRKYSKQLEEFEKKWNHEGINEKRIKGFLILVFIALPFVPLFLITKW